MVTEGNSVISEETRIAANQILLQRNINQQSVPFVASEVKTRKRFFHNEDYWPFVCGGLILFPIAFLFAIQLTSLWISIPLSEADPYEVLLWGIGSSIVLIYCHNRSGEFLFGRWLWLFIIFIIFLGIRSRSGGSFLFYFPSGIIPLLLFEASGWLGILIGRVTGVTKRFMSIESLVEASTTGELPRVQALLAARVDVNGQMANNPVVAGATALMMASRNGHLEVARALLAAKADVNAKAVRGLLATGTDALILASKYGHLEVVRALLAAKADVNAKTADGVTAYAIASQNGHRNIAELLRHHGGHQ
jgi:ankyrin repeat protein